MPATIPDLWPDDIRVDVLTPLAILRTQAGLLSSKTQGTLLAQVMTTTTDEWVQYQLDLIAPLLERYRVSLLTARHQLEEAYPVTVTARAFLPNPAKRRLFVPPDFVKIPSDLPADQRVASTQEEFIELVREVLQSATTRSRIQSLIARGNETRLNGPSENSPEIDSGEKK
jgi:hypothetical protein